MTRHPSPSARVSNLLKRQPDFNTRFNRGYNYKRARCEDPAIIRSWFTLVENTIAKNNASLPEIYNFGETGFTMGVIASGIVVGGTVVIDFSSLMGLKATT
ncbi:hypothetical protein HOO65_050463 [Ceratocystis lukuohia]|uniref:Uncharacterized protein n=1 Tax=Ceratocystis lukuohia TaxID=2019550 RepID=A0ABR4MGI8_9PEZI